MLASEFSRESVELAHALDCNEERLVCCESCIDQVIYHLAQVILQLCHVGGVDRLSAAEVTPPFINLLLEGWVAFRSSHRSALLR